MPIRSAGPLLLLAALLLRGLYGPALAAAGGGLLALHAAFRRKPLYPGPAGWWLPWFGWAGLAAAASAQPWAAVPVLGRWAAALLFFALAASWDERERRDWLAVVLAAGPVLAAAGLYTGLRAGHYSAAYGLLFGGDGRYYGYTAFAVMAAGLAGLGAAARPGASPALRKAGFAGAFLCASYLLYARSRGALLGFALGAAVVGVRRLGARRASALMAGGLLIALLASPARERLLKSGSPTQWGRLGQWSAAAAAAHDAPLHGWGPGNLRLGWLRHPVESPGPARWLYSTDYAHSEPLQAAVETGWAGLLLWLVGLGLTLAALRAPHEDDAGAAALPAAAGMTVMLLADNVLQVPALSWLWFSALACAAEAPGPWRLDLRKALLVLGVPALALAPLAASMRDASGGKDVEERVWLHAHALAFYPEDPQLHADLASVYEEKGALVLADEQWAAASRSAPYNAVYLFRRALLAERRGDWAAAEALHAQAVSCEPQFRDALLGRALALKRLGRQDESRAALAAAKALGDPGVPGYPYADIVAARDPRTLARVEALLAR